MLAVLVGPTAGAIGTAVLVTPQPSLACTQSGLTSTGRVVTPLTEGSYTITSEFGPRTDPLDPGRQRFHAGLDFAAPDGTPILAIADGTVRHAGPSASGQNRIIIDHRIDDAVVSSVFLHMWDHGIHVQPGESVGAGQHIADVGSQGRSTGPHLHLEIRPGGWPSSVVDPDVWLTGHGATTLAQPAANTAACLDLPSPPTVLVGDPGERLDDPTGTGGFVTARMAHLIGQTRVAFPQTGWACWSLRPGTRSEHPQGRACDVTFGNQIGTRPTAEQLAVGWQMAEWLQANAEVLGVEYLIWQAQIWSVGRAEEGWRPYNGGGIHDPTNVTGGHIDHLHITAIK